MTRSPADTDHASAHAARRGRTPVAGMVHALMPLLIVLVELHQVISRDNTALETLEGFA